MFSQTSLTGYVIQLGGEGNKKAPNKGRCRKGENR